MDVWKHIKNYKEKGEGEEKVCDRGGECDGNTLYAHL
jgi:hypothetical protein